jgi:hypothetical protein
MARFLHSRIAVGDRRIPKLSAALGPRVLHRLNGTLDVRSLSGTSPWRR